LNLKSINEILGFGEGIKVLTLEKLKKKDNLSDD